MRNHVFQVRKAPNYNTLERYYNVVGLSSKESEAYHPSTPKEFYRDIYIDVLDTITNAIKDRFDQPSFKSYMIMESFLLKAIAGNNVKREMEFVGEKYGDGDVNIEFLDSELEILKTIFSDTKPTCFKDIHKEINSLSEAKKKMIPNLFNIIELLIVNPSTSCTAERSFSTARRIKSWLRAIMINQRFNNLAILNTYKRFTDKLDLCKIGNTFVSKYDGRFYQFGYFVEKDFL